MLMASVRATMRAVVRTSPPAEAMRYVNVALGDDLTRGGGFVTMFLGQLDVAARRLTYVDAGHGYCFLRRACGGMEALGPRGLPLGVDPTEDYQEGVVGLQPGDALVVYSDGLSDARPDLDREALGAAAARGCSAAAIVDALVTLAAASPREDDLTVLVLTCAGT
jgi:sigma-B regulation protein RsbU (phosphoserine phosphatase)